MFKVHILFLFTNEFPYGRGEAYLETEVKYYHNFKHVYVFSLQLRKEHASSIRELPDNFTVVPIFFAPKIVYILNVWKALIDPNLYRELKRLYKSKRLGIRQLVRLFIYLSRAHYEAEKITEYLLDKDINEAIYYSYRFEYQPYVAMLVGEKFKNIKRFVCRGHRYDLYEDRAPGNYIPMREEILSIVDTVYPCSQDGTDYLKKCYPEYNDKIKVSYLGTIDNGEKIEKQNEYFNIISCSNLVPVKRVEKIVYALANIEKYRIRWTHFGDGELMTKIKEKVKLLPSNIQVDLRGSVENKVLLNEYKKNYYDLFINLSTSEGIPVSIMEAMSFGIPCLATNAGGTGEIVENGITGRLIPIDTPVEEISKLIESFIVMGREDYQNMRANARMKWQRKYNADKNYSKFILKL